MALVTPVPEITGVHLVDLTAHTDRRGAFLETYRRSWFPDAPAMVQANRTDRAVHTVVGLHYHLHQTDYWQIEAGRIRVVLHDLRAGSPTSGATFSTDIEADPADHRPGRCLFIPPGVAHGFAALTALSLTYLVDREYDPADEHGMAWDDPEVAADWGVVDPVLSDRDRTNPKRAALTAEVVPRFR
jgi:dTDP-4-dehydrorhamnose 3,5-epimerase